jgi:hypothetical protein
MLNFKMIQDRGPQNSAALHRGPQLYHYILTSIAALIRDISSWNLYQIFVEGSVD